MVKKVNEIIHNYTFHEDYMTPIYVIFNIGLFIKVQKYFKISSKGNERCKNISPIFNKFILMHKMSKAIS